jgi:hypothetical protein
LRTTSSKGPSGERPSPLLNCTQKKTTQGWSFFCRKKITSWLAPKRLLLVQRLQARKRPSQEQMLEQQLEQELLQVQELLQAQELLLFYRKQPRQRQR